MVTSSSASRNVADIVASFQNDVTGEQDLDLLERVAGLRSMADLRCLPSIVPILPLLLNLKGKPYTLEQHFPFKQLFRNHQPRRVVLKTGRQVSKSTSLAAHGVVVSNMHDHFSTLYITPLYEQIRRFSNNYVRPFVDESPVKPLWLDGAGSEQSVLQRSFKNRSKMIFSFALLDADRVRGIQADKVAIDEVQDMDPAHIPIIHETMSASPHDLAQYTGTPKTLDNAIEGLWQQSSQAEWFMRCDSCNTWNIPSMDYHVDKMIGEVREDISADNPAVVCYSCQNPLHPRKGRWVHRYPDKRWDFAGYHVPQIVMPLHYSNADKWSTLVGKRDGWGSTSPNIFYNEVLGESYDVGQKLVSLSELKKAASLPWQNNTSDPDPQALAAARQYANLVLAIDWGGGGVDGVSFTAIAVLGWSSGKIDCLWGKRLLTPHDHVGEAQECLKWFKAFGCQYIAHDYTGAGTVRETIMVQEGFPVSRLLPISYVRAATHAPMYHVPATALHPRDHYRADKTRTLLYTATSIKLNQIRFFQYDHENTDNPGLLHDFLALVETKTESRQASDIYTITKAAGVSDDFAQAVNIGCASLWHVTQSWPKFAGAAPLTSAQVSAATDRREDAMGGYGAIP